MMKCPRCNEDFGSYDYCGECGLPYSSAEKWDDDMEEELQDEED